MDAVQEALVTIRTKYVDDGGRIVMADKDGGDSIHKTSIAFALMKMLELDKDYLERPIKIGYQETMSTFEIAPGQLVRHPSPPWNNPTDKTFPTTRDQVDPAFQAMDLFGDKARAIRVANDLISRGYTYPNGDIPSPEHISHILYAMEDIRLRTEVVHILGDMFLLAHSVIRVVAGRVDSDDTSNDVHHVLNLIKRRKYNPGLLNWLAVKIYNLRPPSGPKDGKKLEGSAASTAVRWYFREETGSPPLHALYEPLIQEYLK